MKTPKLGDYLNREYLVVWQIELSATCPEHAATLALEIQRDRESTATFFTVYEKGCDDGPAEVDVSELPE